MRKEVPMEQNTWVENALECVYSAIAIALVVAAAWLFCAVTPNQSSGEADMERATAAERRLRKKEMDFMPDPDILW